MMPTTPGMCRHRLHRPCAWVASTCLALTSAHAHSVSSGCFVCVRFSSNHLSSKILLGCVPAPPLRWPVPSERRGFAAALLHASKRSILHHPHQPRGRRGGMHIVVAAVRRGDVGEAGQARLVVLLHAVRQQVAWAEVGQPERCSGMGHNHPPPHAKRCRSRHPPDGGHSGSPQDRHPTHP